LVVTVLGAWSALDAISLTLGAVMGSTPFVGGFDGVFAIALSSIPSERESEIGTAHARVEGAS